MSIMKLLRDLASRIKKARHLVHRIRETWHERWTRLLDWLKWMRWTWAGERRTSTGARNCGVDGKTAVVGRKARDMNAGPMLLKSYGRNSNSRAP